MILYFPVGHRDLLLKDYEKPDHYINTKFSKSNPGNWMKSYFCLDRLLVLLPAFYLFYKVLIQEMF